MTKSEALEECAGYFSVPGAHLYTVLHQVAHPVAQVLLVGPFASERHFSYHSSVRWARYLAARRIGVARYDYRGVGESTGAFEEMSFRDWSEDVELLAEQVKTRQPDVPLLFHGVGLGAILAAREFARGRGDALLMWAPQANANQALRAILRRWAGMGQFYESPKNRKPASEFIGELERGLSIEVQGYQWSSRLWRDSYLFELPENKEGGLSLDKSDSRPMKADTFGRRPDALVMPYSRYEEGQDLTPLYASTYDWIVEALRLQRDAAQC